MGGKGGGLPGGGGRVGRGKVNGQLSVVTSVVRQRMGKAPAVQSGRALPIGRCASPPWPAPVMAQHSTPIPTQGRGLPRDLTQTSMVPGPQPPPLKWLSH